MQSVIMVVGLVLSRPDSVRPTRRALKRLRARCRARGRDRCGWLDLALILLGYSMIFGPTSILADPLQLGLDLSAGYDTNPAQSQEGPELAFARYAVTLSRPIPWNESNLGLSIGGWYRDYEAANDSYRLTLGADWQHDLWEGLGLLRLALEGAAYRDALVPADERDEIAVTARVARILNARATLGLTAEARRLAYRNASLPWSGRPGSSRAGASAGRSESAGMGLATRRDDDLFGVGLDLSYDWAPEVATRLSLTAARCDSPVPVQAYWRHGVGLDVETIPRASWRLSLGLSLSRTAYDRAPRRDTRTDDQLGASLALRRDLGEVEGFCALAWLKSDSTVESRSFRQWVSSCGLAWSY
ncbi:hypothetical protein G3480_06480 [Thiorhodococcus mannitoliphagus]|uniref:Uncharacterized protein n=1 Tax=Thiorhodococcus mannitoliphagus TaxID=329406 RepID=A0A6P1DSP7_9GAMM|nr:hypothetical protein [Thiorhodococcus mannitoliphagus]NEX19961.1 hypothetical protein [Thiorhodococcus mannitoliphagus]